MIYHNSKIYDKLVLSRDRSNAKVSQINNKDGQIVANRYLTHITKILYLNSESITFLFQFNTEAMQYRSSKP